MIKILFFLCLFLFEVAPSIGADEMPKPAATEEKEESKVSAEFNELTEKLLKPLNPDAEKKDVIERKDVVEKKENKPTAEKNEINKKSEEIKNSLEKNAVTKALIEILGDSKNLLEKSLEEQKKKGGVLQGKLNESEEKSKENVIQKVSLSVTNTIETSAQLFLNIIAISAQAPVWIVDQLSLLRDESYRYDFYTLMLTLTIAAILSISIEVITRRILVWLNIHRPKEFTFRKIPVHVMRNVTPVILFGLAGYAYIYYSQTSPEITYRGFIVMTSVIMLRTSWLVLRVLFSSRYTQIIVPESAVQSLGYQFVLAIFQIIIIGIVFAEMSSLLGMGLFAYSIWLRIIGFGVMILLVIGASKTRLQIAAAFKTDEETIEGSTFILAKFIEIVGHYAYFIFSVLLVLSYLVWLAGSNALAWHVFSALIITIFLTILLIIGRRGIVQLIRTLQGKLKGKESNVAVATLGYLEGSLGGGILFVWHLLYLFLIIDCWGGDPLVILSDPKIQPYIRKAVTIIIVLFIIRGLWSWVDYIAKTQMTAKKMGKRVVEPTQFVKTLAPILRSLLHWVLSFIALILILEELTIDTKPIVYGIGFFGIAISLGAQSLVKDIINGILALLEGNIAVGEMITVGNFTGTVESLTLRSISLRHSSGALQTIPFSEVTNIINKSRNYTVVPVEMSVPFHTDIGAVHKVLLSAYSDICLHPTFGRQVLEPLSISGVDKFSDNGFTVTGSIKVRPDPKNKFLKAFNECLKSRMEQDGILPPPSQKIINLNMEHMTAIPNS